MTCRCRVWKVLSSAGLLGIVSLRSPLLSEVLEVGVVMLRLRSPLLCELLEVGVVMLRLRSPLLCEVLEAGVVITRLDLGLRESLLRWGLPLGEGFCGFSGIALYIPNLSSLVINS